MNKKILKDKNGGILIMIVLLVLITILVVLLAYEIIFNDILGIMDNTTNVFSIFENFGNQIKNDNIESDTGNLEVIEPIIGDTDISTQEKNTLPVNHYYYNQLNDTAKIIYKGLEDNIENMQKGNYTINFNTTFNKLLNTKGGEQELNLAFQSGWNAFSYDYVGIFYIDVTKLVLTTQTTTLGAISKHKVILSNGDNSTYLSDTITSKTDLNNKKEYVLKIREQIVSQLSGYSEYDQVRYLHNWMIDNFDYDTTYQKDDIHNICGAFVNKEVVCEGYARAFKYILDGLGIESVLVSGRATNSEGKTESHAWNYVKLNGKWYAIDVTWDDPIISGNGGMTDAIRYKYFLKGSDYFFINHKENGVLSDNSIEFTFPELEKENY